MSKLYEEMKREYAAAQAAELLARQHPDNLPKALESAGHFERVAQLSRQRAGDETRSAEKRFIDMTMAEYFQSQAHKSRAWHAYQRRDCDAALAESALEKQHLARAIGEAEGIVPSLTGDEKAFLDPQLQRWRVSMAAHPAMEYTFRARKAHTEGDLVHAYDWYGHSAKEAGHAIHQDSFVPPSVNPSARRVMRGNMFSTIANGYAAMVQIMIKRAEDGGGRLTNEEGHQLLGYMLEAHRAGAVAMNENPEWQQIGVATRSYSDAVASFLRDNPDRWRAIYARFKGNGTLESIMYQLDRERYAMVKGEKILRDKKGFRLWAIGSFFVFAFAVVAGMLILLASTVPPWVVLPCIVGIEVILLFIGAPDLRATEDLSQANFLKLVALAARFQFRSLLQFQKKPPETKPSEGTGDGPKAAE